MGIRTRWASDRRLIVLGTLLVQKAQGRPKAAQGSDVHFVPQDYLAHAWTPVARGGEALFQPVRRLATCLAFRISPRKVADEG